MAIALKAPECQLKEDEAQKLASATANVLKWYSPVELTGPTGAWIGLGIAAASIYLPRVILLGRRRRGVVQTNSPTSSTSADEPLGEAN